MGKIQAFSSVNVVDLTDSGSINFYLTSNLPSSVMYNPDESDSQYSPDWSSTHLVIKPVISYNGTDLSLNAEGLTITYSKREGSGESTSLSDDENVVDGILTVSSNKLANVSSKQLTYICNITYTNPVTDIPVSSEVSLTYNLITLAPSGESPIILELYSADGGTVASGRSTTIQMRMWHGPDEVTEPFSVKWYSFNNGTYEEITGETGTSIIISPNDVDDVMWLKCEAVYEESGRSYDAYYTIDDVTDPLTAYTYATITEFKNMQGFGAIYTRVYRNGVEADPIKSTIFSNTPPSNPKNGDYYYYLDSILKDCILKKYNGTDWVDAISEDSELHYEYFRIDSNGQLLDTDVAWKSKRCVYIDPSMINERMQFFCEVSSV